MLANTTLILCDIPIPINKIPKSRMLAQNMNFKTQFLKISPDSRFLRPCTYTTQGFQKKGLLRIRQGFARVKNSEDTNVERTTSSENELRDNGTSPGGGDWTTSALLFLLWVGLMYYVFNLTPNQTPSRDMYFLEKLLNLRGEDGFRMNQVLVALWYIMGLWPLVYSMLLLPAGRSSKGKVPVWPFLVLSCFGGAYVLLPYFVLWRPPPPPVEESELGRWPLNFLESKLTAGISLAAGLGLLVYAGLADGNDWKEFFQYFRESKFIHLTSIDFSLLSTFAPFWVYNDMSIRKWSDKGGSWLLPISLIPLLGPALYLLLRPSIAPVPASVRPSSSEQE